METVGGTIVRGEDIVDARDDRALQIARMHGIVQAGASGMIVDVVLPLLFPFAFSLIPDFGEEDTGRLRLRGVIFDDVEN